jgi:hypothetical protein
MGIAISSDFDVEVTRPIDGRMIWTGSAINLNNIPNKYPGLTTYVTGDQNLYVFQGGTPQVWEKVVTNNVDSLTFSQNFEITPDFNGQVIYSNSVNPINCNLAGLVSDYAIGYNITVVQEGVGNVTFTSNQNFLIKNRSNFFQMAGQYAVASLLRVKNTNTFLLYGDLI